MYGDWLDEAVDPEWKVHGNEVKRTERKRCGGKRKAREEGQGEGDGGGGGGGGGGAAAGV